MDPVTRKSFFITLAALMVVIAGLVMLNRADDNRQTWDTEHPMVNTNVSWEETWHKGAWSDAG